MREIDYQNFREILIGEVAELSAQRYYATKEKEIQRLDREIARARDLVEIITAEVNEAVKEIVARYKEGGYYDPPKV